MWRNDMDEFDKTGTVKHARRELLQRPVSKNDRTAIDSIPNGFWTGCASTISRPMSSHSDDSPTLMVPISQWCYESSDLNLNKRIGWGR
jgi:hypothetical protein